MNVPVDSQRERERERATLFILRIVIVVSPQRKRSPPRGRTMVGADPERTIPSSVPTEDDDGGPVGRWDGTDL